MNGLGEALNNFHSRSGGGEEHKPAEHKPEHKSGGKYHSVHIHAHKDGSHHLMVTHGGQLVHHSEHASPHEALEEAKNHVGGGEPQEEGAMGGESQL